MLDDSQDRSASVSVPPFGGADHGEHGESPVWRWGLAVWCGPVLIVAVALAMLIWTWGTWPDVLVDFGHERYIPWRLAEGEVLYRDIAFYNGPLSQYFNAVCFRVFGASLRTLVFCNLAILAVLVGLLYYVLRQVSRPAAATAACVIFLLLFAFAQFVGIGNYNYVCPYSHEATHGLVLSLAAVAAAWPRERCRLLMAIVSGLALGLAFLTKAEVFLPGAAGAATALILGIWWQSDGWRRGIIRLVCFLIAMLAPPVIAFTALASAMPADQALSGTLGSWVVAFRPDLTGLPFFRSGMGIDRPIENLQRMLEVCEILAAVLVPAGLLGLALRRPGEWRTAVAVVVFVVVAGPLWYWRVKVPWTDIARPWPLLILLTAVAVAFSSWSHRRDAAARHRLVQQISLLIFALLLLTKMILNARIFHYGFVLAMPATLLLSVAAFDWIPTFIDRRGGSGRVFIAAAAALFTVTGLTYLNAQRRSIDTKKVSVGVGADRFWADDRGAAVNAIVAQIAGRSSPETTLAVLPEGIMINCLAGLRNPTPYIHLMPIEVMLFGEERICEAFRAHPPDLIVLAHKNTSEFGFTFFGRDYAQRLGDWINANYQPRSLIGSPPLQDKQFGIRLLERNDRSSAEPEPMGD